MNKTNQSNLQTAEEILNANKPYGRNWSEFLLPDQMEFLYRAMESYAALHSYRKHGVGEGELQLNIDRLKRVRNYFGEHDVSAAEHRHFFEADEVIKFLEFYASQSLPQQPDSIQQLIIKIKQRMDLLPDDPVPSERAAYDAYLNCLNWCNELIKKI